MPRDAIVRMIRKKDRFLLLILFSVFSSPDLHHKTQMEVDVVGMDESLSCFLFFFHVPDYILIFASVLRGRVRRKEKNSGKSVGWSAVFDALE